MWFGCFRGLGFRYSLGPVKSYLATIVFHVGHWVLQSSRTLQSWQIPCSRLPPTEKAAESSRNRPALPPLRFRSFLRLQASSAVPTCFIPCLPSAMDAMGDAQNSAARDISAWSRRLESSKLLV